ncbi:nuclear pore complex protein Nup107-like isoform X1, partial [Dinothrombium tinctorium]
AFVTVNQSFSSVKSKQELQPNTVILQQFLEAKRKYSKIEQIFDLLQEYENICSDHLTVLLNLKSKTHTEAEEFIITQKEEFLRNERNTWRLARVLYEDRLKNEGKNKIYLSNIIHCFACLDQENTEDDEMVVDNDVRRSDREVIDALYDRDSKLRQMQLVIDWLEQNENDALNEEETFKLEFYSEGPYYWENTLHYIVNYQDKFKDKKKTERELCLEMDPDASLRTSKPIHDIDIEDEDRLMKFIFRYLRAGKLNEGKLIAHKMGYHWLAAALSGWMLFHDPNLESGVIDGDSVKPIEGNAHRDLWKYVCWMNVKNEVKSIYERAVFGALSGNLKAFLPLCQRWCDKLWAYFRVSVDVQIERELRQTDTPKQVTMRKSGVINSPNRTTVELDDEYWSGFKSTEEIFRELESHFSSFISVEEKCHQLLQKFIILDDVGTAVEMMWDFIKNNSSDSETYWHMLRFFAHLVLFFKHIELLNTESLSQIAVYILESYISHLIEIRELGLIAPYVACLPRRHQIPSYAKLLQDVTDASERKLCLKYAKQEELDVEAITKSVVESIRNIDENIVQRDENVLTNPLSFVNLPSTTTNEDSKKIEALEWLLLNNIQYTELLLQANGLMRFFELHGKIDAARDTFRKLPVDIIDGVFKSWRRHTGLTELSPQLSNAVREYLCHKAYFQAYESFDEWLKFYHNSKPQEPKKPASTRYTDKVAFEYLKKQYEADLEQWKILLAKQAKLTADKIYNVLIFPDGGWMTDVTSLDSKNEDKVRSNQLAALRKKVIPQLTFVLHSLLYSSNHLQSCLKIADIIASEHYGLYKEFHEDQIKDFLRKLRESAIAALNESFDALGYSTNE